MPLFIFNNYDKKPAGELARSVVVGKAPNEKTSRPQYAVALLLLFSLSVLIPEISYVSLRIDK